MRAGPPRPRSSGLGRRTQTSCACTRSCLINDLGLTFGRVDVWNRNALESVNLIAGNKRQSGRKTTRVWQPVEVDESTLHDPVTQRAVRESLHAC